MDHKTIESLAEIVDEAARTATPITKLTATHADLDMERGYDVQRASMARRFERGEKLVGMKMGLTSRAKMEQMGVHDPIYGHLTDEMRRSTGDDVVVAEHCHPRVEPEVAFIMGRDLAGDVTAAEAIAAVEWVVGALEVIDSRYENFEFTLPDVVADNASSTRFYLGETLVRPDELDLGNLGMIMSIDGEVVATGSSAAILEHPARSLATLARMLHRRGESLKAGQIVLAGGATKAVHLKPGNHVLLEVQDLGTVELRAV